MGGVWDVYKGTGVSVCTLTMKTFVSNFRTKLSESLFATKFLIVSVCMFKSIYVINMLDFYIYLYNISVWSHGVQSKIVRSEFWDVISENSRVYDGDTYGYITRI